MAAHSRFSASSASRWINCPGSVFATEQAIAEGKIDAEDSGSSAAREGTCAHWVLEMAIKLSKKPKAFLGKSHGGVKVNAEMVGHIEEVIEWLTAQVPKGGKIITERRYRNLRLLYDLDIGGTVDITILAPGILKIFDFKYGRGYVNHINNYQINIYSLAAYLKYTKKYNIKKIIQGIMQPRSFNEQGCNRIVAVRPSKLMRWERNVLVPALDLIKTGTPPLVPGNSQCEWCRIRGICKEQGQQLLDLAQTDFKALAEPRHQLPEAKDLTYDQLALIVNHESQFKNFIEACKARVNRLMVDGEMSHETLKVVAKNKSTKYVKEEDQIITSLKRRKVPTHIYLKEPKLVSHGILRTNLTGHWGDKGKAASFVQDQTETIDNGYTVVPVGDPKKEVFINPQKEFEQFAQQTQETQ